MATPQLPRVDELVQDEEGAESALKAHVRLKQNTDLPQHQLENELMIVSWSKEDNNSLESNIMQKKEEEGIPSVSHDYQIMQAIGLGPNADSSANKALSPIVSPKSPQSVSFGVKEWSVQNRMRDSSHPRSLEKRTIDNRSNIEQLEIKGQTLNEMRHSNSKVNSVNIQVWMKSNHPGILRLPNNSLDLKSKSASRFTKIRRPSKHSKVDAK